MEIKILMAPSIEKAREIKERFNGPLATVECEYGDVVVEGAVTLAHHASGWDSAPALASDNILEESGVEVVDGDYIMVSHVDLDTVFGVMNIANNMPFSEEVKKGVNYVDCNGQHNLFKEEVSEEARRVILAYIGYASRNRCPQQEDITEYVRELIQNFFTQDNYEAGLALVEGRSKAAAEYLTAAVGNVALLDQPESSNIFGLNSEYIIGGVEYDHVIVFNRKFGSITMSSKSGAKGEKNMATIMKAVFGEEAGGHKGIAGTPRGVRYSLEDATNLLDIMSRIV